MRLQKTTNLSLSRTYALRYNNEYMVCFFDDACYRFFLLRLFNSLRQFHVELHAYCLTAKEIHLLLTPGTPYGINNLWKSTIAQYNSYFAKRFNRSVRIISGSYRIVEVSAEGKALELQRTIERTPVEKLGVDHPGTHPWSSYCNNGFGNSNPSLTPHREFLRYLQDNRKANEECEGYAKYRDYIAAQASSIAALSDKSV